VNNTLQFKGQAAADSLARFGANTVFGLGGVLDVASEMRIEKHTKDFGHTLGYWGVGPGPYLVLPLLGSSTLRDTAALPVDMQGNLVGHIGHVPTRNSLTALRVIDTRSELLKASAMLEQAALDKYTFTRDAHLQRRRSTIFDGNPPDETTGETWVDGQDWAEAQVETAPESDPETLSKAGLSGNEKEKP
jgi:phospholipid-binding lipoprotein MlaA